jgi:hypothetical protein
MKKLKLNLQQFEGAEVLTRNQLKKILGGKVAGGDHLDSCSTGTSCSVYDNGQVYTGSCTFMDIGGGLYVCECDALGHFYNPSGGESHCNI